MNNINEFDVSAAMEKARADAAPRAWWKDLLICCLGGACSGIAAGLTYNYVATKNYTVDADRLDRSQDCTATHVGSLWEVIGSTGNKYDVSYQNGKFHCSCKDFQYRHEGNGSVCKHIASIL